jgi:hypothetical protein
MGGPDRDYQAWLSARRDALMYVSRSVQSQLSGKRVIPVAHRIDNPDGSVNMISTAGDSARFSRRASLVKDNANRPSPK